MAGEVWWAPVFGFAISGVVQAWVPRERIESATPEATHATSQGRETVLVAGASARLGVLVDVLPAP